MVSVSALLMLCALTAPPQPVLLEFTTPGCAYCQKMEPVLGQLSASGYPVQKVQADQQPQLARRFHVTKFPTFVLVSDGNELQRIEGATTAGRLEQMFQAAGLRPDQVNKLPRQYERLLAASVRLTVEDPKGSSFGSGTMIDQRDGSALVLTCGHLFRESAGKGRVRVELFDREGRQELPGQLLKYDLQSDLALIVIQTSKTVSTVRVAPKGYRLQPGNRVLSVGCNNGEEPSVAESQVSGIDKFLGTANVEVAGQPAQGRSGGGLFTIDGLLVGVCNAADPTDNEGLYAAASTIQAQLDDLGLAEIYKETPLRLAVNAGRSRDDLSDAKVPSLPDRMPTIEETLAAGRQRSNEPRGLSALEAQALTQLREVPDGAEVICIIRPLRNPQAKSDVIYLDRASPAFLQQLADERKSQDARHLTSLSVERTAENEKPSDTQRR